MKEEGFATAVQPDIQETSAPVVPKEYRLYFGLLVTCFALWGLLNNMTDNLVPSFAKIFMIKAVQQFTAFKPPVHRPKPMLARL